ncbi:MAG TPA: glycoside hydrolase family 5 protein [Polyangiaceae bacterium]|nr:glycoside hydrolase family 5 protein [Polyangiaceae bacterium]
MLRSTMLSGLLLLALATPGCDIGGRAVEEAPFDPSPLEVGDNSNFAAEQEMGPTPVELHGQLHITGTELRDAHDKRVQLKGVSSMWLNWENDGYAESLEGLKWLRNNWNLSVVRASMGIAEDGGFFDNPEKARAQVVKIVDNAIAAGVYVIIDWHSHDAHEQTEQSVAFFKEMASKYAGVPNVLYETFNEPTNVSWSTDLKPYHTAVVAAIREIEPNGIIVLGTPNWSQDVDKAAREPVVGTNLMYALHFYACTHGGSLIAKARAALLLGVPLFVTEWGATHADGGRDGLVCVEKAQEWMDFMNPLGISWAAWKFDNCTPDSTCFLTPNAPVNGGWTSEYLRGHGLYLRARMQEGG